MTLASLGVDVECVYEQVPIKQRLEPVACIPGILRSFAILKILPLAMIFS